MNVTDYLKQEREYGLEHPTGQPQTQKSGLLLKSRIANAFKRHDKADLSPPVSSAETVHQSEPGQVSEHAPVDRRVGRRNEVNRRPAPTSEPVLKSLFVAAVLAASAYWAYVSL